MKLCFCGQPALDSGLCPRHFAIEVWKDNTDIDHLGIYLFFKKVIPKAFKSFKYGFPQFHKEILWETMRDNPKWIIHDRKIVIAAPRGSSKTTLLSKGLVLFYAATGIKKYIVIASKTGRAAQKNLRWIKNVLGSSAFINIFGDLRPDSKGKRLDTDTIEGKWASDIIVLKNGVTIECVGMGQQLRSSAEGEDVNRIDFFLADDTETDENTKTPERRETNEVWFFETVIPSLDIDTGTIIFINTLTHSESILAKLLASDGWRKKFYQISYTDEMGKETSLWEEKFPLRIIDAIRDDYKLVHREVSFYKEYYNIIRTEGGFNPRWIKKYSGNVFYRNGRVWIAFRLPGDKTETIVPAHTTLGIDLSYTYNERSNYTVLLPLATIYDYRRFVLPYSRGRFSTFDDIDDTGNIQRRGVINEALRLHEQYHFSTVVVDASGTQAGIYEQIKRAFGTVEHPPMVLPFRTSEEKYSRLRGLLSPEYEYGRVHHLHGMDDLERELVAIGSTTDDILDALYNALIKAKVPAYVEYSPIAPSPALIKASEDALSGRKELQTNWMVL